MKTWFYLTGVSILGVAAALAQGGASQREVTVRGEVSYPGVIAGGLTVEIDGNGAGPSQTSMVQGDGSFELRSVSPGVHQLRVSASGGTIIHSQQVMISAANQPLSIHIEPPPSANRFGGGSISVRQLNHKVPAQAQSAFDKGERAALKGTYRDAADLFRQAIALDPEFADAYNELAAAEAELGDLPHSAEHFQKAVDLVPEHRFALPNLSIVLAKLDRYHEAGEVARRALVVVPGSCKIHYILAVSLLKEDGDVDEVLLHLTRATDEVPRAHLVAADLLLQKGRREEAVRHLEDYLQVVPQDDAYRARVEARLVEIRQ